MAHVQSSHMLPLDIKVQVAPAHQYELDPETLIPASINVWPFGDSEAGIGHYWSFDISEARQLADALIKAAAEAEDLFGKE